MLSIFPVQISYLSARSQDKFIKLLGQHIQQTIIAPLNNSLFHSIMIDSIPDIFNREIYTIFVRLTNSFNVEERLVSVVELPNKTGSGICSMFFSKIEKLNISPNELIA